MQNDLINKLIKSEYGLHPKAQLIDYYKLFFQGTFGAGHFIKDRSSAAEFLRTELETSVDFEEIEYQDISYINNIFRVNINLIKKGIISFDDFLDAFLKSAEVENIISKDRWMQYWQSIEQQILKLKIPIKNFDFQSTELWKIILSTQNVSHSKIYHTVYSPHYRLFNTKEYERLLC
ncbi:MAG: hypothetical protein P9M11_11725 [Candidatus Tenebribacter burtonii]|nr:hypothetical protein [Candidatus Tenebribacter burtonii]